MKHKPLKYFVNKIWPQLLLPLSLVYTLIFIFSCGKFHIIAIYVQHMNSQSPPLSPTSSQKKESSEVTKERGTTNNQSDEREVTPPPHTADEEWVEYVDSFGRSRSCLRKDLSQFIKLGQQAEERKEERKRQRNRLVHPGSKGELLVIMDSVLCM